VVRGTLFVGYKVLGAVKVEGDAAIIIRIVLVDLERYSIYSVGVEVEVEVVLPDRAILGRGLPPTRSRFRL
jgi:hypothetical protein